MKLENNLLAVLGMALVVFAWTNVSANDFGTTRLRLAGSGSMTHRMAECAKEFNQKNPEKSVMVTGGHTGDGFAGLFARTAEIAMASRQINENEKREAENKGMKITEKIVGYGILVIVVHPSNSMKDLTIDQLRKVFQGEYKNWSEVGGSDQAIQLIVVDDPKSGTVFHFKEDVLSGKPFPTACKKAETFLTLTKLVAQTEGSVGFCHTRDLEILQMQGKKEPVKALSLKRDASSPPLAPVRPASGESSYPLMRPYYLYWDASANSPLIREFVDFCNANE